MRMNFNAALVAACLASLPFHAFAAQPLLPPARGDQVPTRLVSLPAPAGQFERAPVSFSWALDPRVALSPPTPYVAESREYWRTVDGVELQKGVSVQTSAPGAVIRISPRRGAAPIEAKQVGVTGHGKAVRLEQATSAVALQAAGMDVQAGTAVVKLARENGAGAYSLHARNAKGRYVVHVYEPESAVRLKAHADRQHALGGETVTVTLEAYRDDRSIPAQAEALLVAPDGSSLPVRVARDTAGRLAAKVKLPAQASSAAGLWELQLFATADGIARDARTAFGVAAPTARLRGDITVSGAQLRAVVPLESASPGRYEVRGTLYATASDGSLAPVSQAHSAAWFGRGKGSLVLAFDRAHVPSGYGAPYEIRDLQLNDQSRMAPLETRSRAARF